MAEPVEPPWPGEISRELLPRVHPEDDKIRIALIDVGRALRESERHLGSAETERFVRDPPSMEAVREELALAQRELANAWSAMRDLRSFVEIRGEDP